VLGAKELRKPGGGRGRAGVGDDDEDAGAGIVERGDEVDPEAGSDGDL
jgi:hypothetical protein